ncbi:hypothetical protein KCU64_g9976, partial [Aureobasidium melanogenum]
MPDKCELWVNIANLGDNELKLESILNNIRCGGIAHDHTRLQEFIKHWGGVGIPLATPGLALFVSWMAIKSVPINILLATLRLITYQDAVANLGIGFAPNSAGQQVPMIGVPNVQQGSETALPYVTLFAAQYFVEQNWIKDPIENWLQGGLDNLTQATDRIRHGTSQMSVITVLNHTDYVLELEESSCYKGEAVTTFNSLGPNERVQDGNGTMVAMGIFASTSDNTAGSASAIQLLVRHNKEQLDRVVIAAADPIVGKNTFLVSFDDKKVKDLADENDTQGNGNDYSEPWGSRLPKSTLQLDVRVEKDAIWKFCHVIATFSQP